MKYVRVQMYSLYERIWHWVQAAMIIMLIGTGLRIHFPTHFYPISFATAVTIHNVLGFILVANAVFGLFYYLTTGTIRQHLPEPRGYLVLAFKQAKYYMGGIFRNEPHPLQKTPENRLNPLQQATYLGILNVLLPIQGVTGLLMWSGQQWPETVIAVGGMPLLAMIHGFVAWLFGAFVVTHIYMTTTGHTPLANIKAMIFGYEELPEDEVHHTET